jgi:hypothetical protein
MNTRQLIALTALAFGIASPALAQEATPDVPVATGHQAQRADVRAQALAALRAGELHESYLLNAIERHDATGERSRAEVRAETIAALRSGAIDRLQAEAWSFADRLPAPAAITHMAQAAR